MERFLMLFSIYIGSFVVSAVARLILERVWRSRDLRGYNEPTIEVVTEQEEDERPDAVVHLFPDRVRTPSVARATPEAEAIIVDLKTERQRRRNQSQLRARKEC